MKLLVFSDIHNDKRALERLMATEADAYVCAGDLVSWARGLDAMGEILRPRAERMYVLPGNHESEADIAAFCARFGFTALHGKVVEMGGVQVAGLGYSNRTPFNTPGEYSEQELGQRLEAFAGLQPLVLICHCPPKDTPLDGVKEGRISEARRCGSLLKSTTRRGFLAGISTRRRAWSARWAALAA